MAEKKYYIRISNTLVEVSPEIYREYYHFSRKMRTIEEKDLRNSVISYNSFDNDESLGEEIIADPSASSVEETAIRNLMVSKLHYCLTLLSNEEKDLIYAIFYDQASETEIGQYLGISQKAVNKRKKKILQKLQKSFNE